MRISDWSSDVCSSDLPESSTNCAAPCHCTTACSSAIQDIPSIQRISVGRKAGNHGRRWMKKILLLAAAAGVLAVPGMAIAEPHGHGQDEPMTRAQLGSASCRASGGQFVWSTEVAGDFQKKK